MSDGEQVGLDAEWERRKAEYEARLPGYHKYCAMVEALLREFVLRDPQSLPVHDVQSRVKSWDSCLSKCQKPGTLHNSYDQLDDLIGLRIIVFFDDDIDKVDKLLTAPNWLHEYVESRTDHRESDDRPYNALHLVMGLGADRERLPEYADFGGLRFEVQIRTLLSHTWSEIEHDRGYKLWHVSGVDVRPDIRRHFRELAIVLQNTDRQFKALRDQVAEEIGRAKDPASDMPLSLPALVSVVESDACEKLDLLVADGLGLELRGPWNPEHLPSALAQIGISTTGSLRRELAADGERAALFGVRLFQRGKWVSAGTAVRCLAWLRMLDQGLEDALRQCLMDEFPGDNIDRRIAWLRRAYKETEG